MGIYAPERAVDAGGALLVMGADADVMASIESRRAMCLRGAGTISAIAVVPPSA